MATKKKALKKKAPAVDKHKFKQWREQGAAFKAAEHALRNTEFTHQWAIADWMRDGEKSFGKTKAARTKTYDEAEKVTGFTRETLEQFAHTAKKVLIRVKGVSFGHHRLVAKFKGPDRKKRQKKELIFARKHRLSVERFDLHLKGLAGYDKQQRIGPTSTDIAAKQFMTSCDNVENLVSLRSLLSGEPPAAEHREGLVKKIKETAAALNETAERLRDHWQTYLPLAPACGLPKEQYEKWKSHAGWRAREAAKSVAAGSGQ
jgi:hypothetical protein